MISDFAPPVRASRRVFSASTTSYIAASTRSASLTNAERSTVTSLDDLDHATKPATASPTAVTIAPIGCAVMTTHRYSTAKVSVPNCAAVEIAASPNAPRNVASFSATNAAPATVMAVTATARAFPASPAFCHAPSTSPTIRVTSTNTSKRSCMTPTSPASPASRATSCMADWKAIHLPTTVCSNSRAIRVCSSVVSPTSFIWSLRCPFISVRAKPAATCLRVKIRA